MGIFFWRYELEPEFPLCVLDYETTPDDLMHSHDYLEVALCLEGSGRFLFGRRECPIEPGDVFLIDNLEAHVALPDRGGRLRLLLVLFLPELIAAPGCRSFDTAYLTPFSDAGLVSRRIACDSALAQQLRPILFELGSAWQNRDPLDRYVLDANLRRFLGVVMKHRGQVGLGPDFGAADGQQHLGPALAYIANHFREPITLEQVAELVHVSASRARHLFKEATTVGFKEYVTKLRLAEAKRLLLETERTVSDVASAVGYSNINQFYKVFHRYTAMSPADYRRYYVSPAQPMALFGRPPAPGQDGGTGLERLVVLS